MGESLQDSKRANTHQTEGQKRKSRVRKTDRNEVADQKGKKYGSASKYMGTGELRRFQRGKGT